MNQTKKILIATALLAITILPTMTGCISVKREEPTTTSTTTTSVRPSVISPSTTTVERTTTY